MTRATTLKLSLLGAFLSLGAFAANDVQTKRMKDNAEFVEKAALFSKTQVNLSELAISQSTNTSVKEFAQKVIDDHDRAFDSLKAVAREGGYSLPFGSIGSGASSTGSVSPGERLDDSESASEQLGDAAKRTADDVADTSKKAADDVGSATSDAAEDVQISQSKNYAKASEKAQDKYNDLAKLSGEKFDKGYLSAITKENDKAINMFERQSKGGWDSGLKSWADETLPTLRQHEELAKSVKQAIKDARPSM